MRTISKQDLERLSQFHSSNSISIYIPTHRSGKDVIEKLDPKALKNELKMVKIKLQQNEVNIKDIESYVAPINELLNDSGFWRKQSDGLAIFLGKDVFETYKLPIHFESFNYVGSSFYLKQLMPMFVGDGAFYFLSLQLEHIKLYKMTRQSVYEVKIEHLIPHRLEDSVGYEFEEKGLQFRNQNVGYRTATYHGHAESDHDHKDEISRYFRDINKGLMTLLVDENVPLLVASQDYLFAIYKGVNTYRYLLENHLSCDSDEKDKLRLHEKAWKVMGPIFDKERKNKIEDFEKYDSTNRTSSDINEVLPAAFQGKIDTLFIENGKDIFGVYDDKKHKVEVRENPEFTNVSLLNMAAIKTFLQGGKVYVLDRDDMPNPYSKVNALFRF